MPEKSGLPSAVRGVGASMSALPLSSRGIPASGYFGHCALIDTEQATMMAIAPMNAESALFTLKLSSDRVAVFDKPTAAANGRAGRVPMLIRQQWPDAIYRLEG